MTDPKVLNQTISEGQSAMYARQLEETIRAVKSELATARQGLADVARVLCPDQVDVLTGKHPGSSAATLPLEELITTMKGVAQTLRLIAANSTKSPGSKEDILLERVTELEGLLRAEKRRADLFERAKANAEQMLETERTRAAKAAEPMAYPLVTAFVVLPTESSASVTILTSSGSPAISAIPPALSVIGP